MNGIGGCYGGQEGGGEQPSSLVQEEDVHASSQCASRVIAISTNPILPSKLSIKIISEMRFLQYFRPEN
jgi:hypothetical protein